MHNGQMVSHRILSSSRAQGVLRCLAEGIGESGPTGYEATTNPLLLVSLRSIESRGLGSATSSD